LQALTEGPNIPLDKPIVLIGRHQECDIQIPSRKISRRHCCIAQVADHLVVRDLGSTNGVRINGIKVVEGNLQPNDEVTIGNMRYQVKWGPEPEQAMNSAAKNGIKAGHPENGKAAAPPEPREVPSASPDEPLLQVKQPPHNVSEPSKAQGHGARPFSMEIPDDIQLIPLEPPAN
jgi:predicted component of type VI protein secretion system